MDDKVEILKQETQKLYLLLTRYSEKDPDVREALDYLNPLIKQINDGEIIPPHKFVYKWIFFRGENNLMNFPDLINAAADFSNALECKREYAE